MLGNSSSISLFLVWSMTIWNSFPLIFCLLFVLVGQLLIFSCLFVCVGISRDSRHKRRATGGRKANLKKKRMYESGRPPANTKLGAYRVHPVRCRGGNMKFRAMRLETGNFAWGSESKIRFLYCLILLIC